jgi:hypothetical protein
MNWNCKSRVMAACSLSLGLAGLLGGCDAQKMENMEVGVTSESQVRAQWGTPDATYTEADGAQVLAFSRQPAGQKNYMIVIGTDGKLRAIRQVLTADNFGKVAKGMSPAALTQLLGKPAKVRKYDLKPDEETWEWRWLDGNEPKVFSATFGADGKVVSSGSVADKAKDPS